MKVLVACEESQEVCKAFRALGHEAYSCDIEPCSGGHPEWHLQVDALEMLKMRWDTAARRRARSMKNEKLFLALRAGARAISNNKRLHGTLYCWDIWGENGGPKEISYLEAADLLAETADKMKDRPLEGEEET